MVKEELNQKSPLRKLEALTGGGVGKGNIGVIASTQGIGKTACLVHISVDTLLRDKHVIHVSFDKKTDYISNWYEDIFKEISQKRDLESAMEVHDSMIQNRIIMNFHHNYPVNNIIQSLKAMVENGQDGTDLIIVDGFDFSTGNKSDLELFKGFAKDKQLEVWFSDVCNEDDIKGQSVPENLKQYGDTIKTVLTISNKGQKELSLTVVKHDGEVKSSDLCLDPKTLLIC